MATDRQFARAGALPGGAGRLVLAAALVFAPAGCLPTQTTPEVASAPRPAPPLPHVKVGGAGVLSEDVRQAALTREELVARVDDFLARQRPVTARRWLERYPDVALEALRGASCEQARTRAFQAVARAFDEQCGRADPGAGWVGVLQQRAEHPERFTAYDSARARLARGRPGAAVDATVPAPPSGPAAALLAVEADQLAGQALLRAGQPEEAVTVLSRAANASRASYPYQAAQVLLVLSDAARRAGQKQEAVAAWRAAAELAAGLLAPPQPVNDPILWERLSAYRPVTTPWPALVGQQLARRRAAGRDTARAQSPADSLARNGTARPQVAGDEALLWAEIGRWRLERGESQAALLAYKRAEGATADEPAKESLRLAQARALVQMDQAAAATEVLVRLAFVSSPAVSRPALATLGSLKFQQGQVQQSLALLKKAVEEGAAGGWPGRAEAEADLGLAYLTTGDEASGLRCLHSAQQHFAKANDRALLAQCLENEAAYHEHVGKPEEAARLRQRKQQLEGE